MSDSVGSVSVEVVPDARGWSEKLRAQIRDTTATVNVDADTGKADAEIDEAARTRTATIKVNTDKSVESLVKNVSLLPALFIAAGAAAVPLAATIGGLAAALAAPLVIAGGGVGLFAIFGALAAKQTEGQLKNIDTLQKKLAGLTKGTKDYADTQKQLRDAQAALTPAQKQFASSLDGLKGAFSTLLAGKSGQALLSTIASGMDLLSKTLPVVAPVLASVAHEFGSLLDELSRAAGSKGFADFIHDFAHQVGPDIDTFAHVAGNIAKGFGGLFLALDSKKLSGGVLDGLLHLSQNFADLGQGAKGSQWLRDFIDYFHKVGPQVADTAGAVARAIGHIVSALAPLGPPVLHIVKGLADALSSIPAPVLTGLLAATAGVSAAGYTINKGLQAKSFLSKLTGGGGGLAGGVLGAAKVVPVFVTNEGFGGPGGIGGVAGKAGGLTAEAEGAAAATATRGFLARALGKIGLGGLAEGGLGRVVGAAVSAPALITAGDAGNETHRLNPIILHPSDLRNNPNIPAGVLPSPAVLKAYNATAAQATRILGLEKMIATSNHVDALNAQLGEASRGFDVIGHSAAANSASAIHSIAGVQKELNSIHDKKIQVIAQTASAVASLERLQAMRIADKHFTVYQRFQALERTVGPGGGMGQNPHGSGNDDTGTGDPNGASTGTRTHVHVHLDDSGLHTLTGYMDHNFQSNYQANRSFEDRAAGR